MMLKILTAAALVATANGAVTNWINANGMCGGIDEACTDMRTCSTTGLGPCAADEKAPKWHITSEFVAIAFTAPGYLTDTTKLKQINPTTKAKQGAGTVNGFRNYDIAAKGGGGEYIYTMAGGILGGDDTAWGYAGIASYFNSGNTSIVTDSNDIYGAGKYNPTARKRSVTTLTPPPTARSRSALPSSKTANAATRSLSSPATTSSASSAHSEAPTGWPRPRVGRTASRRTRTTSASA